jgi:hypothetical protein
VFPSSGSKSKPIEQTANKINLTIQGAKCHGIPTIQISRNNYLDEYLVGGPRGRSSSPDRVENVFFFSSSARRPDWL